MGQYRQLYRLNRTPKHAWAMLRTLMDQIILYEKITTTCARAKAVWPILNKLLNFAKKKTPSAYQKINSTLRTPQAKSKVFNKLVLRYKEISGNLVKIVDTGLRRKGDRARMFNVQLMNSSHQISDETHMRNLKKVMDIYPGSWEAAVRTQELQYYINVKVQKEKILDTFKSESIGKEEKKPEELNAILEDQIEKYKLGEKESREIKNFIQKQEKDIEVRKKKEKKEENFDAYLRRVTQSSYNDHLINHARAQINQIEKIMRHPSGSLRYENNMIHQYAYDEMLSVLETNCTKNEQYDIDKHHFFRDHKKSIEDLRKAKMEARDRILNGEATKEDVEIINKPFKKLWVKNIRNASRLTEKTKQFLEKNKANPTFDYFWVDAEDGANNPDPDYKGPKRVPFYKKKSEILDPDQAYELLNQGISDNEVENEFMEKTYSKLENCFLPRNKKGRGSPNKL